MLNIAEAYAKIRKEKLKVIKAFEYKTLFVFQVVPENFDMTKTTDGLLDCLRSVNKETGQVRDFKPLNIPLDEYRNGKELKTFE